ncbi:MAG: radical SAM protein [Thermoplasmatales archaeon]|nr:MAG: radical SAM protein [Thermoplasmatales archaeon]
MENIRTIHSRYFEILEKKKIAKYLQCKQIPASFKNSDSTKELWKKHGFLIKNKKNYGTEQEKSLLDLKIELAYRIFQKCCFCERRCGIDRKKEIGNCKVKKSRIASEFLHIGEENILVPSYTVFFSGCTFKCVFCQNWDISQEICGIYIEPSKLAKMIHEKRLQGAKNVNWVGGDPTPNLHYILKTIKKSKKNLPQVWNSNMYCSDETMNLLDGVIDLYLTDFKYGNNNCAKRMSKVDRYTEIIKRNHKLAYERGGMIIRHLVMPNHINCCSKPIIKWISENLPKATVNIMAQYRPKYNACDYEDISRPILKREFLEVKEYAKKLNICEI